MPRQTSIRTSAAALWASAFVIAGLILTQASKLGGNAAIAGTAAAGSSFSVVTANTGAGGDGAGASDVVYVIDSRDETLLVYEIEDIRRKEVILRDGGALNALFRNARP
jgi:hypothetical protein